MKKVEYSQLVKRKLLKLKMELIGEHGEQKAKEILIGTHAGVYRLLG